MGHMGALSMLPTTICELNEENVKRAEHDPRRLDDIATHEVNLRDKNACAWKRSPDHVTHDNGEDASS